jgi:hypothetical protein
MLRLEQPVLPRRVKMDWSTLAGDLLRAVAILSLLS